MYLNVTINDRVKVTCAPVSIAEMRAIEKATSVKYGLLVVLGNQQVERIIDEGDTQDARVIAEGDTQDARVIAEGDIQIPLVTAEGDTQVARVIAEGDIQEGRAEVEADRATTEADRATEQADEIKAVGVASPVTSVPLLPNNVPGVPTVSYDPATGLFTYGIPIGSTGEPAQVVTPTAAATVAELNALTSDPIPGAGYWMLDTGTVTYGDPDVIVTEINSVLIWLADGYFFNIGILSINPSWGVITGVTVDGVVPVVGDDLASTSAVKTKFDTLAGAIGNINSPLLDLPLQNSLTMNKGVGAVAFTRATEATYIDRYGVLKTAAIDEARFEKDGLLIEGASTNELLYSEDFSNAEWESTDFNTTVTVGGLAPDGISNSSLITADADVASIRQSISIASGEHYTNSIWARRVTGTGTISMTSVENTYTTLNVTDKWKRFYSDDVASSGSGRFYFQLDIEGDEVEIWGAQIEELPFTSSYIATTDSTVTREADFCNVTPHNNLPNLLANGEVTFSLDVAYKGQNDTYGWLFGGYTTSTDNYGMRTTLDKSLQTKFQNDSENNGNTMSEFIPYAVSGASTNVVMTGDMTSINSYIAGELIAVDSNTSGLLTETQSQILRLGGHNSTSITGLFFGNIKNFKIYDFALSPTEISLL